MTYYITDHVEIFTSFDLKLQGSDY